MLMAIVLASTVAVAIPQTLPRRHLVTSAETPSSARRAVPEGKRSSVRTSEAEPDADAGASADADPSADAGASARADADAVAGTGAEAGGCADAGVAPRAVIEALAGPWWSDSDETCPRREPHRGRHGQHPGALRTLPTLRDHGERRRRRRAHRRQRVRRRRRRREPCGAEAVGVDDREVARARQVDGDDIGVHIGELDSHAMRRQVEQLIGGKPAAKIEDLENTNDKRYLRRRYIACFPEVEHPYDALLDDFEPGMRTARLRSVPRRLGAWKG